jgi:hypothetical protein
MGIMNRIRRMLGGIRQNTGRVLDDLLSLFSGVAVMSGMADHNNTGEDESQYCEDGTENPT